MTFILMYLCCTLSVHYLVACHPLSLDHVMSVLPYDLILYIPTGPRVCAAGGLDHYGNCREHCIRIRITYLDQVRRHWTSLVTTVGDHRPQLDRHLPGPLRKLGSRGPYARHQPAYWPNALLVNTSRPIQMAIHGPGCVVLLRLIELDFVFSIGLQVSRIGAPPL